MAGMITLDELVGTYLSERGRNRAEPPLETAARVLSRSGEWLEGRDVRELVSWASEALAHDDIASRLRFPPRTVALIERHELPDHPKADRTALLAAGLVARCHLLRADLVHADLATGRRTLRDLTRAEYSESQVTDTTSWSALLLWFGGWIPAGIVAIGAGIVAGFISGDWRPVVGTALGGTIFGYVAAIGAMLTYLEVDHRWLRRGQSERVAWEIVLSVGPAVALLVAVLVLINA
jgi:hypothetical protein